MAETKKGVAQASKYIKESAFETSGVKIRDHLVFEAFNRIL